MTRFLLIRHGLNDTVGVRFAGRMPGVALNAEGKRQADELAQRLSVLPINAVYSSPLERAVETARPLAQAFGLEIQVMEEFNELDMGEWTGRSFDEVRECSYFGLFNKFRSCTPAPDGELMLDAQARMVRGLLRLRTKHAEQTVAVVSHSDPIKAVVCYLQGQPLDMYHRFEIEPASVSIVEVGNDSATVLALNSTGPFQGG
jgi:broad specificity phosphatase PhoE